MTVKIIGVIADNHSDNVLIEKSIFVDYTSSLSLVQQY